MMDWFFIALGLAVLGGVGWEIVRALRGDGADALRADIEAARAQAVQDKKEKGDEVNHLGPADLDRRFDRWRMPDDPAG